MNLQKCRYLLSLIILLLICNCGEEKIGRKEDKRGYPKRIVSLAPSITESLYLLGVEDRVVGVTVYCKYPEQAKMKDKVGTLLTPNLERIYSLRPDLVLATREGNREKTIKRLRDLGLKVFVFDERRDFRDICNQFLILGKMVGKRKEAMSIVNEAKKRFLKIKRKAIHFPKVKVFWEIGARPLVTVAKGTFSDQIIRTAGGVNIAHRSQVRYPRYSLEEVIRKDPDVIILVEMGDITSEEIKSWQRFKDLSAVKNRRIYTIEAHSVCSPTPITFVKGVEEVFHLLHY
ncbi:MAG: cobalamin-binding protein [bacterium]|nr:cobalamin-binding protein [bacterium]